MMGKIHKLSDSGGLLILFTVEVYKRNGYKILVKKPEGYRPLENVGGRIQLK
jgi:hypothetical protein